MMGSKAKEKGYALQMLAQGKGTLQSAFARAGPEDHAKNAAAEEPAAGQIAT
jgi:hypothetical protein